MKISILKEALDISIRYRYYVRMEHKSTKEEYYKKLLAIEAKRLNAIGSADKIQKISSVHKNNPTNVRVLEKLGTYVYQKLALGGDENNFPKASDELNGMIRSGVVKRNRIVLIDDYLAVKYPDQDDKRDENVHEACVGLQVNTIRRTLPNFVWTYGIIRCNPLQSMKGYTNERKYKCCITERVNGVSFSLWGRTKSFREKFIVYVQLWLALAYANREIGLTHNDLHMGNALIIHLPEPITIDYEETTIKTSELVKIIDFGRSFAYSTDGTRTPIGRPIPGQSIRLAPNYWYDAYFILQRSIRNDEKKDPEVRKFIDFFDIHQTGRLYDDMRMIVTKTYNFDTWLDLIFNCPSGKALLKRKIVERKIETPRIQAPEKINLPSDFHFEAFKKYLETHDYRDSNKVNEQIHKNENRVKRLIALRALLKNRGPLPSDLKILNPDDFPESKQEKIVAYIEEIVTVSQSIHLKRHIEFAIEKYNQRLDFLLQWLAS